MIRFQTLRAEGFANLRLALPLIAAQLAGVGMGAVDTVFAGRLGPQALAAVAMGFNLQVVFFVFFMGVHMACSPIVAQMVGSGRTPANVAHFINQAKSLALISATLWAILLNLAAEPVLTHIGLSLRSAHLAVAFVHWLSLSAFGMSFWFTLRFSAEGLASTRPVMWAGVAGLGANALLDWLLLFPHPALNQLGLPLLGAPGCGLATTLASLLMAGVLAVAFRSEPSLRIYHSRPSVSLSPTDGMGEIIRLGVPIGLVLVAETGLFVVVAMLAARFGDVTVAAYQVAINFAAVLFMIPVGISMATTVRVSRAVGAGDRVNARLRGYVGMGLGVVNAISNASIMLFAGLWIARLYTDNSHIAALAAKFLILAAGFQFFDGLQVTANGALRGFKDTRFPALITLVAYWLIGLPVACGLAFGLDVGPDGLWWGLTAGLGVAAVGLCVRFRAASRSILG